MITSHNDRRHRGLLARITRASAHHPWRTLAIWLFAVVAIAFSSQTFGGKLVNDFSIPNSDAQRATDLLQSRFPAQAGDSAQVIFNAPGGLRVPSTKTAVTTALSSAAHVPGVTSSGNPYKGSGGAISKSGTIGYAFVQFRRQAFDVPKTSVTELEQRINAAVAGHNIKVAYSGQVIQAAQPTSTGSSELIGIGAAIIVLLIVFGTFVAAGLPILLALISLGLGLSLLTLAAALTHFNTITPILATMIGLGVGIDYSLFIVTRFRQALHEGMSPEDAAATAGATAGRAVVFAGVTVAISISGLAVIGLDFVTKLGFGAAITVLTTVITAVTLLPAILRLLGHRIDRLRLPFVRARDESEAGRGDTLVARWGRFVTGHARPMAMVACLLLIALLIPVTTVQLGSSDSGSDPRGSTFRQAYDLLAKGFGPGFNGPLLVAVDTGGDRAIGTKLAKAFRRAPGVSSVPPPLFNHAGDTAAITVFPTTQPQSAATSDLVSRLRRQVVPAVLRGTRAHAYIGGQTAAFDDIAKQIFSRLPLFLLVVVGITFLVLSMAFRSVVIAAKAALATLGSALASFGALILVFQHGYGLGLIGLDRTAPIESFLPVIVFAILFGLSMDYEVFLVSRIREEYVHGDTPRGAITHGMTAIGRVVMAAATIMATVFFSFMLGDSRIIKEFGLALGVAIVADAFIIRLTLVPAVLYLLDGHAWYMPRWLDRVLPRITIEPPTSGPEDEEPAREAAAIHRAELPLRTVVVDQD
jgi:putative drug exporter of the RND superfamily